MNELLLRRRVAAAKPYDSVIEYLKTPDGLPYINTGYVPNNNTSIEIKFKREGTLSNFFLFGARPADANDREYGCMPYNNSAFDFRFGNKKYFPRNLGINSSSTYTIITNKNYVTLKDSQGNTRCSGSAQNNTFNSVYTMFLFGSNMHGSLSAAPLVSIYYCKIYDNTTLVRDYIPVRKGSTGYLYDRVSGTLFGNPNDTGAFILGPDV